MKKIIVYRVMLNNSNALVEWTFTDYNHATAFMRTAYANTEFPTNARYSLRIEEREDDF